MKLFIFKKYLGTDLDKCYEWMTIIETLTTYLKEAKEKIKKVEKKQNNAWLEWWVNLSRYHRYQIIKEAFKKKQ